MFLDKTLYSQNALSLFLPDVKMDARKFNAGGLIIDRLHVHVHVVSHPILGGVLGSALAAWAPGPM